MIASEWLLLMWWLSIDGELYVVIKKLIVEVLELKEGFEFQGKYSMGSSLFF